MQGDRFIVDGLGRVGGLRRAVNPIMVDNIAIHFDCRTHPRSVSEDWCLFVDVCCRSCLFLMFLFVFFVLFFFVVVFREVCISSL